MLIVYVVIVDQYCSFVIDIAFMQPTRLSPSTAEIQKCRLELRNVLLFLGESGFAPGIQD